MSPVQPSGWQSSATGGRCSAILWLTALVILGGACTEPEEQAVLCGSSTWPSPLDPPRSDSTDSVLLDVGFDTLEPGAFTSGELNADWNTPAWENGVEAGRARVVDSSEGQALQVSYPEGQIGSGGSGVQWQYRFEPQQAVQLTYQVRFPEGFEFVRGGKLPGLAGGEANTGGRVPTGADGWSGRVVWEAEGCGSFYLYHPDMEGPWGEYVQWPVGFEPGQWHQIDQVIVINTPGQHDGALLGWLDGELVVERRNLRLRDVDAFAVDVLYVSTFFGGGDETYAPKTDQAVEFDNFVLRSVPRSAVER